MESLNKDNYQNGKNWGKKGRNNKKKKNNNMNNTQQPNVNQWQQVEATPQILEGNKGRNNQTRNQRNRKGNKNNQQKVYSYSITKMI